MDREEGYAVIADAFMEMEEKDISGFAVIITEGQAVLLGTATNAEIMSSLHTIAQTADLRYDLCPCERCKEATEKLALLKDWLADQMKPHVVN